VRSGRRKLIGLPALVLVGVAAAGLFFREKSRVVVPGRVYRSGQLSPEELEETMDRHGIRAILNLRGEKQDREWYRREVEVAGRRGVVHRSVDLLPERLPSRPALAAMIDYLETLPEPILIHCAAGVDRTGFASVVARLSSGTDLAEAREELGLRHGHLPFGPSAEIGRVFGQYEAYLRETAESDSWRTFTHWAREVYVPYVYSARLEPLALPSVVSARERMDVRLRITNTSPGPWTFETKAERGIKLGVRLRSAGSASFLDYDRHAPAEGTLAPGARLELAVPIWAPREPGEYELKLDMVDEHVTWFEDQGSPPLLRALSVRSETDSSGKRQEAVQFATEALAQAR
jgi:protein tyrosine/serine phosphatase